MNPTATIEAAVELLRLKGAKDVNKRAGPTAANGLVAAELDGTSVGVMVELNCETDFVAKTDAVPAGRRRDRKTAILPAKRHRPADPAGPGGPARARPSSRSSRRPARALKEKLEVGRFTRFEGGYVASYLHRSDAALPPTLRRARPARHGNAEIGQGPRPAGGRDASAYPPATKSRLTWWRRSAGSPSRSPATRASPSRPSPQDRRGPGERLLQGRRAAGAGVRQGPKKTAIKQVLAQQRSSRVTGFARFQVGQA